MIPRRDLVGPHVCSTHPLKRTMAIHRLAYLRRTAAGLVVLVALVGCGSGPSESDIERVVKASLAQERAAAERIAGRSGDGFFPTVHGVKKRGCTEASSSVYTCDVELDVTPPGGARTKSPTTLRFAKGSDGWAAMR